WAAARRAGGGVLLRIEDHDRQRSRPEYERAILDDLAWLGFEAGGPPVRQSNRADVYRAAAERLAAQGLVYGGAGTRAGIEAGGGRGMEGGGGERRYPHSGRRRGIGLADGGGWRLRMEPGVERFDDLARGPQTQAPSEQFGDLLIRDRLGNWTYQ